MIQHFSTQRSTFVWLCCFKLCVAFVINPGILLRTPEHSTEHSSTELQTVFHRLSKSSSDIRDERKGGRGREVALCMSKRKTITLGVTARYGNTTLNGEPIVPVVLELTGNRVDLKWDYVVSDNGPVSSAAEQACFKTLVKRGEFTSSFQLSVLRLSEIAAMCRTSVPPGVSSKNIEISDENSRKNGGGMSSGSEGDLVVSNSIITETLIEKTEKIVITQKISKEDMGGTVNTIAGRKIYSQRIASAKSSGSSSGYRPTVPGPESGSMIPEKMLLEQALSLRKQMLVDKIVNDGWRMRENVDKLRKQYAEGVSVAELCVKYDLPPVAIFREILNHKAGKFKEFNKLKEKDFKKLMKECLRGEGDAWDLVMTDRDKQELADAKAVDNLSFAVDDTSERLVSTAWEDSLYAFLDSNDVSYVPEQFLKDAGSKCTPDCVFLDDLYINGKLVRWIDMKCFYGTSNARHFVQKLMKQAQRYDEEFGGPGAIIYKLGYSENLPLKLPTTLFLDRGPLNSIDPYLTSDSVMPEGE